MPAATRQRARRGTVPTSAHTGASLRPAPMPVRTRVTARVRHTVTAAAAAARRTARAATGVLGVNASVIAAHEEQLRVAAAAAATENSRLANAQAAADLLAAQEAEAIRIAAAEATTSAAAVIAAAASSLSSAAPMSIVFESPGQIYLPAPIESVQAEFQENGAYQAVRSANAGPVASLLTWHQVADFVLGDVVSLLNPAPGLGFGPDSIVVEAFFQCVSPGQFLFVDKIAETGTATPFGGLISRDPRFLVAAPNAFLLAQSTGLMRPHKQWPFPPTLPMSAVTRAALPSVSPLPSSPAPQAPVFSEVSIAKKDDLKRLFAAMQWCTIGCFASAMGGHLPQMGAVLDESQLHTVATQIPSDMRGHRLAKPELLLLFMTCSWSNLAGSKKHLNFKEFAGPNIVTMSTLSALLIELAQFADLLVDPSGKRRAVNIFFCDAFRNAQIVSEKFHDSDTDWFIDAFTDWFAELCNLTHNVAWRDKLELERSAALSQLASCQVHFTEKKYSAYRSRHPLFFPAQSSVPLNPNAPPFVNAGGGGIPPPKVPPVPPNGKARGPCLSALAFLSGVSSAKKCARRNCLFNHGPSMKGLDKDAAIAAADSLSARNPTLPQCVLWLANKPKITAWIHKNF